MTTTTTILFVFLFPLKFCIPCWKKKNNGSNQDKKEKTWRILVLVGKWRHHANALLINVCFAKANQINTTIQDNIATRSTCANGKDMQNKAVSSRHSTFIRLNPTWAVSSISLISLFARAIVRSYGIRTCGILVALVFRWTLVNVWNKMNTTKRSQGGCTPNKTTWQRLRGRRVPWALIDGKKKHIYILSGSLTIIPSLDWNYLSSFFRLLHIPFCKYNCKILWYSYMWHSRGTCFQMNTRQCLEPNEHNSQSRHAVQTKQRGDDHYVNMCEKTRD